VKDTAVAPGKDDALPVEQEDEQRIHDVSREFSLPFRPRQQLTTTGGIPTITSSQTSGPITRSGEVVVAQPNLKAVLAELPVQPHG
jgi:hypothetical protein